MAGQGESKKRRRQPTRFRDGSALARADGRARDIRAIRDGARAIVEDQGGEDAISFLAKRTALRVMFIDGILSRDELALAEGKEIDRPQYVSACQTWLRYVATLGLQRRARKTETPDEYARRKYGDRKSQEASVIAE